MKKILTKLLLLSIIALVTSVNAAAVTVDGLNYSLNGGEATVTGLADINGNRSKISLN